MKLRERTVHVYDVIISSHASREKEISNPNCASIVDILTRISKNKLKYKNLVNKSTEIVEIYDWKHDLKNNRFEILINRADRNVSDITFKHFETRTARKAGKKEIEGIECSSHVVIAPSKNPLKATLLLTVGSGITIGRIETMLNILVRELKTSGKHDDIFKFSHPSGERDEKNNVKKYSVRYRFQCVAQQSTHLTEALKNGHFVSMDLISHSYENFDAGGNLQIQEQTLSIKPTIKNKVSASSVVNAVRRFVKMPKGKAYNELRVRYTNRSGRTQSAALQVNNLDAAFTRREIIDLDRDVQEQQTEIDKTIIDAMIKLLD